METFVRPLWRLPLAFALAGADDDPDLMTPILGLGDHIHPNPFGDIRMRQGVDLRLFDKRIPVK